MQIPPILTTARMRIIPATAALVRAEIGDRAAFAQLLGADIPAEWPPEILADALPWFLQQLEADPQLCGWLTWYGVCEGAPPAAPALVGSVGFFGPPQDGMVEIGYSVLPQFQRRGLASEMVAALIGWAFTFAQVRGVCAEIDSANTPSLRLVRALGFTEAGAGREPGSLRFELPR